MKSFKENLKPLIPETLLSLRRKLLRGRYKEKWGQLETAEVFERIYREQLWGNSTTKNHPFHSGGGSHDKRVTSPYINSVTSFLESFDTKPRVLDLGCGDFNVGKQLREFCAEYIACDIVEALIQHNKVFYKSHSVDFRVLNLATDPLPTTDVIFVREVLQHLSNSDIQEFSSKVNNACRFLICTEGVSTAEDFTANLENVRGPGTRIPIHSGIDLQAAPFNLASKASKVICEVENGSSVTRTTVYEF